MLVSRDRAGFGEDYSVYGDGDLGRVDILECGFQGLVGLGEVVSVSWGEFGEGEEGDRERDVQN